MSAAEAGFLLASAAGMIRNCVVVGVKGGVHVFVWMLLCLLFSLFPEFPSADACIPAVAPTKVDGMTAKSTAATARRSEIQSICASFIFCDIMPQDTKQARAPHCSGMSL